MIREVYRAKREAACVAYWGVVGQRVNSSCCDASKRVLMAPRRDPAGLRL